MTYFYVWGQHGAKQMVMSVMSHANATKLLPPPRLICLQFEMFQILTLQYIQNYSNTMAKTAATAPLHSTRSTKFRTRPPKKNVNSTNATAGLAVGKPKRQIKPSTKLLKAISVGEICPNVLVVGVNKTSKDHAPAT